MKRVANVIGTSGLVGQQLVSQLLDHPDFELVRIFVRRKTGMSHPKLEEHLVDFDKPEVWKELISGDVSFSTMGTTLKTAKTKENQYRVDFTYQYNFAKVSAENGVYTFILVSSMGANAGSSVFYSRMKGELEDSVSKFGFKKLLIMQPSILDGNRVERRVGEAISLVVSRFLTRFILKEYRPTPVDMLAAKMIRLSLDQMDGIRVVEGSEILKN